MSEMIRIAKRAQQVMQLVPKGKPSMHVAEWTSSVFLSEQLVRIRSPVSQRMVEKGRLV